MDYDVPLRVLLIDDDEDDYVVIRALLSEIKDFTYELSWFPKLDEAKIAVQDPSYDACLLDYRLGNTNGLDFLLEPNGKGCNFPFILLTGYGDREVDLKAMKSGASDFLVKSNLNSQVLERSIRYAIYRKKAEALIVMQDRMSSVGLLASGLAHEIGTPMAIIRGRAELLVTQSERSEQVTENATVIIKQIDRITKLVTSLLHLARGEKSETLGAMLFNKALEEVLELLQHEFRTYEITLKNELPADIRISVTGNKGSLHQVILNLLVNSIHAIKDAKNSGRTQNHFIRIFVESVASRWVLRIEDSGCGISKANLQNLYKPFFTTRGVGVGTGLGLATSYNIVESWNGKLSAVSQEGVGATFSISLPKG